MYYYRHLILFGSSIFSLPLLSSSFVPQETRLSFSPPTNVIKREYQKHHPILLFSSSKKEENDNTDDDDDDSDDSLPVEGNQLSQFEKDLVEAFGKENDNVPFSWESGNDSGDDDEYVNEIEAFELYTKTINTMKQDEKESAELSDEERKLVEKMVDSTKKLIMMSSQEEEERDEGEIKEEKS